MFGFGGFSSTRTNWWLCEKNVVVWSVHAIKGAHFLYSSHAGGWFYFTCWSWWYFRVLTPNWVTAVCICSGWCCHKADVCLCCAKPLSLRKVQFFGLICLYKFMMDPVLLCQTSGLVFVPQKKQWFWFSFSEQPWRVTLHRKELKVGCSSNACLYSNIRVFRLTPSTPTERLPVFPFVF